MGHRCVGFKAPGSAELLRKLPGSPEFGVLARVGPWTASQKDNPSRPEAIGRLAELGLAITQRGCTKKATKAAEMASQAIDRLGDLSATDEEWQLRKRRSPEGAPARWGMPIPALISIDASKSAAARSNFASGIARLVWVN